MHAYVSGIADDLEFWTLEWRKKNVVTLALRYLGGQAKATDRTDTSQVAVGSRKAAAAGERRAAVGIIGYNLEAGRTRSWKYRRSQLRAHLSDVEASSHPNFFGEQGRKIWPACGVGAGASHAPGWETGVDIRCQPPVAVSGGNRNFQDRSSNGPANFQTGLNVCIVGCVSSWCPYRDVCGGRTYRGLDGYGYDLGSLLKWSPW